MKGKMPKETENIRTPRELIEYVKRILVLEGHVKPTHHLRHLLQSKSANLQNGRT